MQKVLRRTAYSNKRGKRLKQIDEETKEIHARAAYKNEARILNTQRRQAIIAERGRRRAHWELGPLSPWRSNFKHLVDNTKFGVWDMRQMNFPIKPEKDRQRHIMLREGDRVVVIEGHESIKGHVGKIKNLNEEAETVSVEGIGRIEVAIPQAMAGQSEIQTSEVPLPLRAIRLVYPLPDPITGVPRDVILNNLTIKGKRFDIYENKEVFERWVEPQHFRIPWPEKKDPVYKDEDFDTLRQESEDVSFLPTLLRPPMPMGIIDELRNKYSKYRDRHDDEYIAQKQAEDAAEEVEKQRKLAAMPRGARNIARRKPVAKNQDGDPVLTDELAAQIGKHMSSKQESAGAQ